MAAKSKKFDAVNSVFGKKEQTTPIIQGAQTTSVEPIIQTTSSTQGIQSEQATQGAQGIQITSSIQTIQSEQAKTPREGTKGNPYHRINTGYTLENYEFLNVESRKRGMWPSNLVNLIVEEYRKEFEKSKKNGA